MVPSEDLDQDVLGGTFRRPVSGCVRWYLQKTCIRMCYQDDAHKMIDLLIRQTPHHLVSVES